MNGLGTTASEMLDLQRQRSVSSVELIKDAIRRIELSDPVINAVVSRDFDRALERAEAADSRRMRGDKLGPLHGVPITVKESFHVKGLPTTFGRPEYRDHRAGLTAVAVERLIQAGAIVIGKSNVPTNLADCQTANALYGQTSNPHNPERTCGGSSGGSGAALAAGYVPIEVGSDLAGSIRTPAHFCGVFGHKSTYGAVPTEGHSLSEDRTLASDIAVVGPMASSASDLRLAFDLMASSPDEQLEASVDLPRMKFAVLLEHERCAVSVEVQAVVTNFAKQLAEHGAAVDFEPRFPFELGAAHDDFLVMYRSVGLAHMDAQVLADMADRARAIKPDERSFYAAGLRAAALGHGDWLKLANRREIKRGGWQSFFETFDFVLCPVHSRTAFAHQLDTPREHRLIDVDGAQQPYNDYLFWAGIAGYGGLPATVIPIGRSSDGMPIAVQVIGVARGDRRNLALAEWLEKHGLCARD